MKNLRAIGGVDGDLVARAAPQDSGAGKGVFPVPKRVLPVAACACLLIALALFGILTSGGGNGLAPHGSESGQRGPQSFLPSGHGGQGESVAVYHDLDPAQIIGQPVEAKVPAEFWFRIRLSAAQSNKAESLAKWDEQAFAKADVESMLDQSVQDPVLPEGDYTTAGSVLRDVRTGEIIAYAIDYIYFDPGTTGFINSFTVFYFDAGPFEVKKITGTQLVTLEQGEPHIDALSPPSEAYGKVPHVRSLVFLDCGTGIAVEAQADFVPAQDGTIDRERSLERYRKTDGQLVEMMGSLIK